MAKINVGPIDTRSAKRSLRTPVQTAISDSKQVLNNTGGFVWEVSDWDRLDRFLILGTEGGTYYVGEHDLTKQNYEAVKRCLKADFKRTIKTICDISVQGRAYRNEPALLALAVAASDPSAEVRKLALGSLNSVARTGTHLFNWVSYAMALRGGGRGFCNAIANWYTSPRMVPLKQVDGQIGRIDNADALAYQVVKYQQRNGWSHRDVLRLGHPKAVVPAQEAVFRWVIGGKAALGQRTVKRKVDGKVKEVHYEDVSASLPKLIEAFEQAKKADTQTLVNLITEHKLPREAVPTEKLNELPIWEALLQDMPLTAMIRNLAKMTAIGLIKPLSEAGKLVRKRLKDTEYLRKSRVHPMQVLVATKIYAQGHGDKGSLTWTPVPAILEALNESFYATFPNVKPCGKPLLIALDVSGSMGASMAGATPLRACEATAALSLVHASVEEDCHIFGFADSFRELGIRKGMTLEDACKRAVQNNFGSTDVSLAVQYALDHKLKVGGFLVMTDNEVNTGRHNALALKEYRQRFVPDARCIMLATVATSFTCNDPDDKFGLDVTGFDTTVPSVIADFIRGETAVAPEEEAVEE